MTTGRPNSYRQSGCCSALQLRHDRCYGVQNPLIFLIGRGDAYFFNDDAGLIKNDPFNFRPTEINSDSHQCFFCLFVLERSMQGRRCVTRAMSLA